MSGIFNWPPSGSASSGGATAANQLAGNASLTSIDSKTVHVDTGAVVVASSALPSGAATSALQSAGNASLSSLDSKTVHIDTGAVVVASSALPSGAATAALQTTGNASLSSLDSKTVHIDTGNVTVVSSSLPTGASTAANQTTANGSLASIDSKLTSPLATTPSASAGRNSVALVRNDYTITAVTTGAYVQLIASTSATINKLDIFDSSGQTMALAFGGSGSEVNQIYIYPGGNGGIDLKIPASTRVSIIAISANASVGELDINFLS